MIENLKRTFSPPYAITECPLFGLAHCGRRRDRPDDRTRAIGSTASHIRSSWQQTPPGSLRSDSDTDGS